MNGEREGFSIPWEKWAAVTVVVLGASLAVWFFFRFLFGILLPFLLGGSLVALLRPLSEKLRGKTGIPGALVSLLGVLLVGGGLAVLLGFAIKRLLSEASALLLRVTEEGFAARLEESVREFLARIPFLAEGLGEEFSVASLIGEGIGRLGEALPGFLAGTTTDISTFIRQATTGKTNSPDLHTVMQILGYERTVERIRKVLSSLA